jgi:hypothetical protein
MFGWFIPPIKTVIIVGWFILDLPTLAEKHHGDSPLDSSA